MVATHVYATKQISAAQADEIARSMTAGTVGVVKLIDGHVYLMHIGGRVRILLHPSQMTTHGIAALVELCDPWPDL